jgi:2-dehydropantoate 2-reductase
LVVVCISVGRFIQKLSFRTFAEIPIYVLGCGAIGLTLAAYLADAGKNVVAVRTSTRDVVAGKIIITVRSGADAVLEVPVETVSLSRLPELDGIVVVTAKSYANKAIASAIASKIVTGPLVIMQNGIGVENPFFESQFAQIYRCVLYTTGQMTSQNEVTFRPIASSPIGMVKGSEIDLERCVKTLTTQGFPFHPERNIQRDIWKKAIINSVFNSICPLLDVDNGIFVRDEEVARLAKEIVSECLVLAETKGVSITESELMEQIMRISKGSDGVLISTLQDIRNGRQTEIDSLNLEMSRMASSMNPKINVPKTDFFGRMILAKSRCRYLVARLPSPA